MRFISQISKANLFIKILSITKIPLMFFCRPKIMEISDDKVIVKISLNRRTRNHVKSMYFGALAVGADLAGGFLALQHIRNSNKKIIPIFKDFHADFLKRAEDDVYFSCDEGEKIKLLVNDVISSGKRCNMPVHITAYVTTSHGNENVAKFILTLSLK